MTGGRSILGIIMSSSVRILQPAAQVIYPRAGNGSTTKPKSVNAHIRGQQYQTITFFVMSWDLENITFCMSSPFKILISNKQVIMNDHINCLTRGRKLAEELKWKNKNQNQKMIRTNKINHNLPRGGEGLSNTGFG